MNSRSKRILFIHCNASSPGKCENKGSELALPQKGTTSSANNGDERKKQTDERKTDTEAVFYNMHESARDRKKRKPTE